MSGDVDPVSVPQLDTTPESSPWTVVGTSDQAIAPAALSAQAIRAALSPIQIVAQSKSDLSSTKAERVIPAAVLLPILRYADDVTMLMTRRSPNLSSHAGQISFPGGRIDAQDANASAAALREAWEEIGLPPSHVHIQGYLSPCLTNTGYGITPVVADIETDFQRQPSQGEVVEIFEVPLAYLMDPSNHRQHRWQRADGTVRNFYSIAWGSYFIWGATATMLRDLYRRLRQGATP